MPVLCITIYIAPNPKYCACKMKEGISFCKNAIATIIYIETGILQGIDHK